MSANIRQSSKGPIRIFSAEGERNALFAFATIRINDILTPLITPINRIAEISKFQSYIEFVTSCVAYAKECSEKERNPQVVEHYQVILAHLEAEQRHCLRANDCMVRAQ